MRGDRPGRPSGSREPSQERVTEPARRDGARPPTPGPPGCCGRRLPGSPPSEGHHPPGRPQARVSYQAPLSRPGVRAAFRRRRNFFEFPISKFFSAAREFSFGRDRKCNVVVIHRPGGMVPSFPVIPGIGRFLEPEPVLPLRRVSRAPPTGHPEVPRESTTYSSRNVRMRVPFLQLPRRCQGASGDPTPPGPPLRRRGTPPASCPPAPGRRPVRRGRPSVPAPSSPASR